jgi:hypothetical protein
MDHPASSFGSVGRKLHRGRRSQSNFCAVEPVNPAAYVAGVPAEPFTEYREPYPIVGAQRPVITYTNPSGSRDFDNGSAISEWRPGAQLPHDEGDRGPVLAIKDSLGDFAYQCDLTNYADDAVFGVSMTFAVSFLDTWKDENGSWRGDGSKITSTRNSLVDIPKVDPHGSKFIFYIWNGTAQFAEAIQPDTVTLELAKRQQRVSVRLKRPSGISYPIRLSLSPSHESLKK